MYTSFYKSKSCAFNRPFSFDLTFSLSFRKNLARLSFMISSLSCLVLRVTHRFQWLNHAMFENQNLLMKMHWISFFIGLLISGNLSIKNFVIRIINSCRKLIGSTLLNLHLYKLQSSRRSFYSSQTGRPSFSNLICWVSLEEKNVNWAWLKMVKVARKRRNMVMNIFIFMWKYILN